MILTVNDAAGAIDVDLAAIGIKPGGNVFRNLSVAELYEHALRRELSGLEQGRSDLERLSAIDPVTGALVIAESDQAHALAFTRADSLTAQPIELTLNHETAAAGLILDEIRRLARVPTGDESNDNGLGI